MLRDEAVARVRQILGFRPDLRVEVEQALREAQEDAESGTMGFLPWFLRARHSFTVDANGNTVNLPTDFIREYDHEKYALYITGYGPAQRVEYFAPDRAGVLKSGELCYYLEPMLIQLDRRFLSSVDGEYLYYKRDEVLSENIENGWLRSGSQYIIGSAGIKLSGVQDIQARNEFEAMRTNGQSALLRQDTAFRVGSRKPQFGYGTDREFRERDTSYGLRYNDYDFGE